MQISASYIANEQLESVIIMKLSKYFLIVLLSCPFAAAQVTTNDDHSARSVVILALQLPNKLGVGGAEFRTKPNPKGKGVFVYDPRTKFHGAERRLIWLVLDEQAYPLNGPSKMLTPRLKWPREIDPKIWKTTGLDPYMATEALAIAFSDT